MAKHGEVFPFISTLWVKFQMASAWAWSGNRYRAFTRLLDLTKLMNICKFYMSYAGHGGRAISAMNSLRRLKHWDRGFKSHLSYGWLYAFILYLCDPLSAGSGLATADLPSKESYRLCKNRETEKADNTTKGCRAIDRYELMRYKQLQPDLWSPQVLMPCFSISVSIYVAREM
jgi:hypothetical protein